MQKMISNIVACALLSCSFVIFGMDKKEKDALTAPMSELRLSQEVKNSDDSHYKSHLLEKIGEGLEKIDATLHPINQQIFKDVKEDIATVSAALQDVNKRVIEHGADIAEKIVEATEKVENDIHEVIQKLEDKHEAESGK